MRVIVQAIEARCGLDEFLAEGLARPPGSRSWRRHLSLMTRAVCPITSKVGPRWFGQHDAQITSFASNPLYDMVRAGGFMERVALPFEHHRVVLRPPLRGRRIPSCPSWRGVVIVIELLDVNGAATLSTYRGQKSSDDGKFRRQRNAARGGTNSLRHLLIEY